MVAKDSSMKYRFYYHFNKPMTKKNGDVIWSVHFKQKCYFVKNIVCMVPTATKQNKTQPRGVVRGHCTDVIIKDDIAIIS